MQYWIKNHPTDKVVVLDSLTYAGNLASLQPVIENPHFTFIQGSICNTTLVETVLRKTGISTIVNFAAESHVDRSITGPDDFLETNIIGTHSLLKAAKKVWLDGGSCKNHRFHHISTDEVYGSLEKNDPPFSESTAYAPNSPYAASKAASDHLVRAYSKTYGLKTTISNCSNNFGPYQFPEKLIPLIITNILNHKSLPIYGDGHQIRDWLYVEDHCIAIDLILQKGLAGETYNIGGNNQWKNIDIVKLLCRLMDDARLKKKNEKEVGIFAGTNWQGDSLGLIAYVDDRLGHDRRYAINSQKIASTLSYRPSMDLESAIVRTINWYLENRSWWQPLLFNKN